MAINGVYLGVNNGIEELLFLSYAGPYKSSKITPSFDGAPGLWGTRIVRKNSHLVAGVYSRTREKGNIGSIKNENWIILV